MTKIRSTSSSRIQDQRGQGGGGGFSFPGLGGGRRRLGIPMKAGGGILGLIVVLAAISCRSSSAATAGPRAPTSDPATRGRRGRRRSARPRLEQIICGAVDDVSEYWIAEYPRRSAAVPRGGHDVLQRRHDTGCGQASAADGPVLLPGRRTRVLRPRLPDAAAAPVRRRRRPRRAVHRRPRVRPPRAERARREQPGEPGAAAGPGQGQRATPSPSSCRPTASPARGPATPTSAACSSRARSARRSNAAAAVGDDRIQEQAGMRVDPDSFTHGTSEQRVQWFRRGYDTGDPRQLQHVRRAVPSATATGSAPPRRR